MLLWISTVIEEKSGMERYSNSSGEDSEEVWVKNPDIGRVNQTPSTASVF